MTPDFRSRPSARLVQVVEVVFLRGAGVPGDPVRQITAYYDEAGELLAERDHLVALYGEDRYDSHDMRAPRSVKATFDDAMA